MAKTILITGANRGLGLEFTRQYAQSDWQVIAACRDPQTAVELKVLAQHYANIQIETLDVAEFSQIDSLATKLADSSIDILLNNAGVYGDKSGHGFGNLDYITWQQTLLINTIAPLKMAEAFMPQVLRSQQKLIVAISSLMGSLADNSSGGSYLYRSSKAGLNAAMKSLALDSHKQGVGVLIFHPGWVKTDMGGQNALLEVEQSITGMREIMNNFSLEQTGSFIRFDGRIAPW